MSTSRLAPERVAAPPTGLTRLKWVGPGFLWMVSAAGSGELLFTPRVGALYGYALLWALLATVTLKWFINREMGRWAVCTGTPALEGFATLGRGQWALWVILVPQLAVAVAGTAGLGGAAGTALAHVLPGEPKLWMAISTVTAGALVAWGRYKPIELLAKVWGVALAVLAVAAAVTVFSGGRAFLEGLLPQIPEDVDQGEVLPWVGFTLAGAAGLIWYSYWLPEKGYGARAGAELKREDEPRLRGWLRQMTLDNTVAVVGALVVTVAFLVLGAELLGDRGGAPEEQKMSATLAEAIEGVFGRAGFWLMLSGLAVGFWSSTISNQDGHGRMFAHGTGLLLERRGVRIEQRWLRRGFVIGLLVLLPVAVYFWRGQPVGLLKLAGAIEAAHIPVVTGLVLYLNRKRLPEALRPSKLALGATALAGVFFAVFACVYFAQQLSG
jgi:Mn2+/Fe2+ NRAMP family transporter